MPETSNYQKHISRNPLQKFLIDNFYKSLVSLAKLVRPVTVLDVGCGEGFALIKLKQAKIGQTFEGIDYSDEALKLGKKLYPKLNIKKGDIYHLPYKDNTFDMLVCTEVLEHLTFPEKAVKELARVAKKYIVISVPNEPLFILSNFLRGKYLGTFGNHPEHINHWTAHGFKKFLKKNKLRISSTKYPFPWTVVLARK